mgnify:CR=1 FL=1
MSDADLLGRAAAGGKRAWAALYRRHRKDLLRYMLWKYQLDENVADDVLSEVFLRLVQYGPHLRVRSNVRSYLLAMVRNALADRCRQRGAMGGTHVSHDLPARDASAAVAMERAELADRIARALDKLAASHRLALELRQAGLSAREIAAACHCSEKAARRRVEKARVRLRLSLSRCGASCVMGTARQSECPAHSRGEHCLKYLFTCHLQIQAAQP